MSRLHDVLVEHAKFPFPHPDEFRPVNTTDISYFEVGLLRQDWRAKYAVQDDALIRKLCDSLQTILGDTLLAADAENHLLANFSPRLQSDVYGENEEWFENPSEVQVSLQKILESGLTPVTESDLVRIGCLPSCACMPVDIW
jgi:hypothetical protein